AKAEKYAVAAIRRKRERPSARPADAAAAPAKQAKSTNSIIGVETHHVIALERNTAIAASAADCARFRGSSPERKTNSANSHASESSSSASRKNHCTPCDHRAPTRYGQVSGRNGSPQSRTGI